jgi:hypothetical protein
MSASTGTVPSGSTTISNASIFTGITRSDVIRWIIGELQKEYAGLSGTAFPTTLPQISGDLSALQQEDALTMLIAILGQYIIALNGGDGGIGQVRVGQISNPNGTTYGSVGDIYVGWGSGSGSIYIKQSGNGTNTGWTLKA